MVCPIGRGRASGATYRMQTTGWRRRDREQGETQVQIDLHHSIKLWQMDVLYMPWRMRKSFFFYKFNELCGKLMKVCPSISWQFCCRRRMLRSQASAGGKTGTLTPPCTPSTPQNDPSFHGSSNARPPHTITHACTSPLSSPRRSPMPCQTQNQSSMHQ